jgi:hypothetical protein
MAMVNVGTVRMFVNSSVMAVRVAVLSAHGKIVLMVVMPVVVSVSVLVVDWLMLVAVAVALRQMQVHPDAKQ